MGQGRETAAVHVEALEFLESAEGSPLQPAEAWIVTQIQLLQIPQLTEGPCLDPRDVVGEKPQNLMQENGFYDLHAVCLFLKTKITFGNVADSRATLYHCVQCMHFLDFTLSL